MHKTLKQKVTLLYMRKKWHKQKVLRSISTTKACSCSRRPSPKTILLLECKYKKSI